MSPEEEPRSSVEPIGKRLAAARERHNLSVEEVAGRLHLEVRIIHALEAEDYDHLPETMFVRGYLQGYLRLVDLPESLLESFDEANAGNYPFADSQAATKVGYCSRDGWARCITIGLIVILLVAAAIWLLGRLLPVFSDTAPPASKPVEVVEPAARPVGETDEFTGTSHSVSPPVDSPLGGQSVSEIVEAAPSLQVIEPSANIPLTALEQQVDARADERNISDDSANGRLQLALLPDNAIRFTLMGESWIQVIDANGRQLAYSLYDKGIVEVVKGKPPYQVVLGQAENVQLEYQGKVMDLSNYHNRVARFVVGAGR